MLALGVVAALALVPGDEDRRRAVLVFGAVEDRRQVAGQPFVAVGRRPVVHVVDEVRRDEGERRQLVVLQVAGQVRIGHVGTGAAVQRRVISGRVVPHGVIAGVGVVAVRRHRFLVRLPRLALAEDALRRGGAGGFRVAVGQEVMQARVRQPGRGGDVVRQAGVGDVVVVGGQPACLGQRVEVRRLGRADDHARAVVLEPDPDHVLVGARLGLRSARMARGRLSRRHRRCRLAGGSGYTQQRDGKGAERARSQPDLHVAPHPRPACPAIRGTTYRDQCLPPAAGGVLLAAGPALPETWSWPGGIVRRKRRGEGWAMDLRTVASKVVGEMANSVVPFSGPVAESLVQELLGAQDEQIVLLRGLSDDLNRLLDGPWQTARMYLKEAALPRRTPDQVAEALRSASAKLREAAPLQRPGSLLHAHVLIDLAIVERLRGDNDLAGHYAADAYVTARSAMGTLAQHDYGGKKPVKPDGVARLRASGAVYDQIELAAAVICDPRAPQVLTEDRL